MKPSFLKAAAVLIALGSHGCMASSNANLTTQQAQVVQTKPTKSMRAFWSDQELNRYLRELVEKQKRRRRGLMAKLVSLVVAPLSKLEAGFGDADKESESVINVQHIGVDE